MKSLIRLSIVALLAIMISSCSTSINLDPSTHTVPALSKSWVKVRSKPPTWYPRGVAADYPTGHHDGMWIYAEDSLGTRFFIPHHGLSPDLRRSLENEALAARHPERIRQIAHYQTNHLIGTVTGRILVTPILAIGRMGMP